MIKPRIWGTHNFKFDLEIKHEENHSVGALVAQALDHSDLPIPIKCEWKRVNNDRVHIINGITSK